MQMILGSFVFSLQETGVTYQELKYASPERWSQHERVGQRAAYQHLGPGDDEITLPGVIFPEFCGSHAPLSLEVLRKMKKDGKAYQLISAGAGMNIGDLMGKWIILNVEETRKELLGNLPRKIEFFVTLRRVDE